DGQPITTLIDLEPGTQPVHVLAGAAASTWLLGGSGGQGLLATVEDMTTRQRGGKAFLTLAEGEVPCLPSPVRGHGRVQYPGADGAAVVSPPRLEGEDRAPEPATHVCVVSASGRLLTFEIDELKVQPKGGRGLLLIGLERGDTLVGAAAYARSVRIDGVARSGQPRAEVLEARSL
ncbi:DNA gyrase C-terminal beta-propeller domain-containing protein, partial [Cutibacterium acnes]